MCNVRKLMDPSGIMFSNKWRIADPLGLTQTAIGDPTGRFRKERAKAGNEAVDKAHQDWLGRIDGNSTMAYRTILADGSEGMKGKTNLPTYNHPKGDIGRWATKRGGMQPYGTVLGGGG